MRCPSCGAQQPDGATVCVACGSPLAQQTQGGGFNQGPPPYQQNPYQNQQPPPYGYNPYQNNPYNNPYGNFAVDKAEKSARTSLICGIIGLFCCGLILGIVAIAKGAGANRELKSMGMPASGSAIAGIILGIIGIISWGIGLIFSVPAFIEGMNSVY